MPLLTEADRNSFWRAKFMNCETQLRRSQERVAVLATENAMLHLKLAQLLKELMRMKVFGFYGDDLKEGMAKAYTVTKKLQSEKDDLKVMLTTWMQTMQTAFHGLLYHIKELCDKYIDVVQNHENEKEMLIHRYEMEKTKRRALHNSLVEIRGNIRVFCRVRPVLPSVDYKGEDSLSPSKTETVIIRPIDNERVTLQSSKHDKTFEYDRVYTISETQSQVFEDVKPLLTSLIDGFNVCIMAYGQTGSGKTHTMLGPPSFSTNGRLSHDSLGNDRSRSENSYHYVELRDHFRSEEGLIPRAVGEVFGLLSERGAQLQVEVSVAEIYNNELRDLLDLTSLHNKVLSLRQVSNTEEVMQFVSQGLKTRAQASTGVHSHSSRSHLIVTLQLVKLADEAAMQTWMAGSEGGMSGQKHVHSKLQLVDLAGSESVAKSETSGVTFRETSHINRSLASLADTLVAVDEGRDHVPYRNSKLTHYLQDAIGAEEQLFTKTPSDGAAESAEYFSDSAQGGV